MPKLFVSCWFFNYFRKKQEKGKLVCEKSFCFSEAEFNFWCFDFEFCDNGVCWDLRLQTHLEQIKYFHQCQWRNETKWAKWLTNWKPDYVFGEKCSSYHVSFSEWIPLWLNPNVDCCVSNLIDERANRYLYYVCTIT